MAAEQTYRLRLRPPPVVDLVNSGPRLWTVGVVQAADYGGSRRGTTR